jgi:hypothetical protein
VPYKSRVIGKHTKQLGVQGSLPKQIIVRLVQIDIAASTGRHDVFNVRRPFCACQPLLQLRELWIVIIKFDQDRNVFWTMRALTTIGYEINNTVLRTDVTSTAHQDTQHWPYRSSSQAAIVRIRRRQATIFNLGILIIVAQSTEFTPYPHFWQACS